MVQHFIGEIDMKVTRSQAVEGMRLVGLFLVATIPAIITHAALSVINGSTALSNGQELLVGVALGLGLLGVGSYCSKKRGNPVFPSLARWRQQAAQHAPRN